jgi:hypothetical protein
LLSGSSVALAYAIVTKPANGVLVPAFGWYALSAVRGRCLSLRVNVPALMRFGAPLAICFLFLAWLNWFRFGSVLETGYEPDAFMNHFLFGIYGLIFSFNKGIVFYAPLLVLVPVGLWVMRRSQGGEAMLIAGATLAYICLFAKFYNWGGGWSWGPRYLMPIVPLLMMPVARAAATARVWRYAGAGLIIAGLLLNGVGVLVDGDAYHTAIMNVDLTDRTGFVQVGSVADPGRIVDMPVPPDYVLPEFSEIVGKLWLARVAWDELHDAELACNLADTDAASAHRPHPGSARRVCVLQSRPAEPDAFVLCARQPGLHPLLDHRALKLGKHTHHPEHRAPARRAGVEPLLVQVARLTTIITTPRGAERTG